MGEDSKAAALVDQFESQLVDDRGALGEMFYDTLENYVREPFVAVCQS